MYDFNFERLQIMLVNLNGEGNREAGAILNAIRRYVKEDEVINFYPKGLFADGRRLFVHIFRQNDVLIFSSTATGTDAFVKVLKTNSINKIDLHRSIRDTTSAVLVIHFTTGDKFEFSSFEDTNENWRGNFANKIEELFSFLSKNP